MHVIDIDRDEAFDVSSPLSLLRALTGRGKGLYSDPDAVDFVNEVLNSRDQRSRDVVFLASPTIGNFSENLALC